MNRLLSALGAVALSGLTFASLWLLQAAAAQRSAPAPSASTSFVWTEPEPEPPVPEPPPVPEAPAEAAASPTAAAEAPLPAREPALAHRGPSLALSTLPGLASEVTASPGGSGSGSGSGSSPGGAAGTSQAAGEIAHTAEPLVERSPVRPPYPPDAERRHLEGEVEVEILVDARGHVRDAKVRRFHGAPMFAQAVLQDVHRWRFVPYRKDGKPEPVWARKTIRFALR